jgi:hypothetical protein
MIHYRIPDAKQIADYSSVAIVAVRTSNLEKLKELYENGIR